MKNQAIDEKLISRKKEQFESIERLHEELKYRIDQIHIDKTRTWNWARQLNQNYKRVYYWNKKSTHISVIKQWQLNHRNYHWTSCGL